MKEVQVTYSLHNTKVVEQILVWGVSKAMTWHDGPKPGGSGGMLPQELFFKYRGYKINSGVVLALSIPTHM